LPDAIGQTNFAAAKRLKQFGVVLVVAGHSCSNKRGGQNHNCDSAARSPSLGLHDVSPFGSKSRSDACKHFNSLAARRRNRSRFKYFQEMSAGENGYTVKKR